MSDDSSDSLSSSTNWIDSFCSMNGNDLFVSVDEDFIEDTFNLTGLKKMVPHYNLALKTIMDIDIDYSEIQNMENISDEIDKSANLLYGMIHARFLITSRGISLLSQKYRNGDFGICPRVLCDAQKVLPVGLSDLPNHNTVKFYCPKCKEIYNNGKPKYSHLDGAYFGRTAPHLLELLHRDLFNFSSHPHSQYIPKIFGFKIHPSSKLPTQENDL
eukprot:TRINITY_DN16025_c0_g1_i1.p1 TRINITY_DN16025_c0_g1~~TRINITY_DN16025_c0_g1_i1.p1  ORF type:complete len:215 (+),score=57.32 TRINITY_DN16025_c0_g1_i1:85-729(+)